MRVLKTKQAITQEADKRAEVLLKRIKAKIREEVKLIPKWELDGELWSKGSAQSLANDAMKQAVYDLRHR